LKRPRGAHAFLSPSSPAWLNYDKEKLIRVYTNHLRVTMGTKLHKFAEDAINLGIRLPENNTALNSFVNDAIFYAMRSEELLYYTENAFGTADAISFTDSVLRIHDLKTGMSAPRTKQLEVYAALFCLDYSIDPNTIEIVLRIYQHDEVLEWGPEVGNISDIIDTIVRHNFTLEEVTTNGIY